MAHEESLLTRLFLIGDTVGNNGDINLQLRSRGALQAIFLQVDIFDTWNHLIMRLGYSTFTQEKLKAIFKKCCHPNV